MARAWLRVVVAAIAVAAALVPGASPSAAADEAGPVVGTWGQRYFYLLTPKSGVNLLMGGGTSSGSVATEYTIDLSQLSPQVRATGEPGSCSPPLGGVIQCSGEPSAVHVEPVAGAAPGPAGKITVRTPYLTSATAIVDVDIQTGQSTPILREATVTGAVGSTVSLPISIYNPGPNTIHHLMIQGAYPPDGAVLVGSTGCTITGGQPTCTVSNLRSGATFRVTLRFRLDTCAPSGYGGYSITTDAQPPTTPPNFLIVCHSGGSGSSAGGGSGSRGGSPSGGRSGSGSAPGSLSAPVAAGTATPAPPATPAAGEPSAPTAIAGFGPSAPPRRMAAAPTGHDVWLLPTVGGVALLLGVVLFRWRRHRARGPAPSDPAISSPTPAESITEPSP